MADHSESLMDKVKNAFGMGHDEHDDHDHDHSSDDHGHDTVAGAGSAAGAGTLSHDADDVENRPAGPDYARTDAPEEGYGRESGADATVADDRTTVGDAEWTRGGAASGESSLGTDDEVQTERRETGI